MYVSAAVCFILASTALQLTATASVNRVQSTNTVTPITQCDTTTTLAKLKLFVNVPSGIIYGGLNRNVSPNNVVTALFVQAGTWSWYWHRLTDIPTITGVHS